MRYIIHTFKIRKLLLYFFNLLKYILQAGDSDALFPMQLNVLKNRKFAFVVDITEYNVNNYNNIYTVLRVTEDMSIVFELESKIELMVCNLLLLKIYNSLLLKYITIIIFPFYFLEYSICLLKSSCFGIR